MVLIKVQDFFGKSPQITLGVLLIILFGMQKIPEHSLARVIMATVASAIFLCVPIQLARYAISDIRKNNYPGPGTSEDSPFI